MIKARIVFVAAFLACHHPCLADIFGSGANSFEIELLTVGQQNNPADMTGNPQPGGSVPYQYRIGKFEISEQIIDKANTLGGLGIIKDARGPNRPATSVSWNEAARFVNWLNTSTGRFPAYKFAVQPGEVGYNPDANIQPWILGDVGYDSANPYRNSLARYFLPTMHEWYKAAYYNPLAAIYSDYATGSDSTPDGIDFAGDPDFAAVFDDAPIGDFNAEPNEVDDVGLPSSYGTFGQAGNVEEWEETDFDWTNDLGFSSRGVRGGSWLGVHNNMLSGVRVIASPVNERSFTGFRIASNVIPEPSTLSLLWLTFFMIFPTSLRRFSGCRESCGAMRPS